MRYLEHSTYIKVFLCIKERCYTKVVVLIAEKDFPNLVGGNNIIEPYIWIVENYLEFI